MIEYIHARYFQGLTDVRVEFGPEASVLVGDSDTGKTAIIRALGWVAQNKPSGDFTQYGQKECDVVVGVDGRTVRKTRRGKSTWYTLDNGEPFQGVDPPEEIRRLFNMREVNWQFQMDSPFWLDEGGGEVSRQINATVDMAAIDAAVGRVAKDSRDATIAHTAAIQNHATATATAEATPDLREAAAKLKRVVDREERHFQAVQTLDDFDKPRDAVLEAIGAAERSSGIANALTRVYAAAEKWNAARNRRKQFRSLSDSLLSLSDGIGRAEALSQTSDRLEALSAAFKRRKEALQSLNDFDAVSKSAIDAREARYAANKSKAAYQKKIDAVPTCETCGQTINA